MPEVPGLTLAFVQTRPGEAAQVLGEVDPEEVALFVAGMPARIAGPVVEAMALWQAGECLRRLDPETAAALVSVMSPQGGAGVLRNLPPEARAAILDMLPSAEAAGLRLLLTYADHMVGAWMNTRLVTLAPDASARDAVRAARRRPDAVDGGVYVVDRSRRLVGVVEAAALLGAGESASLSRLATAVRAPLSDGMPVAMARASADWERLRVLPVLDRDERLVGALSAAQLRRALARFTPRATAADVLDAIGHAIAGYAVAAGMSAQGIVDAIAATRADPHEGA